MRYDDRVNAVAPVRVLIADDHPMIRWGLAQLVSAEPDLELVGTAEDGARAVELAELEHPDVVLLDLSMPELDGVSAAEQMRERSPSSRVLVLSSHPQESVVTAAFLAGARGYLTKDVSTTDVIEGIRNVHAGRTIGTERLGTDSREGYRTPPTGE
ncbi:MAG: response regulator transcription factor [Nocardioidaceae bacterium]